MGSRVVVTILAVFTGIFAAAIGVGLGFTMAETANIRSREDFLEFNPALPSRVLDINGYFITEFSADERRELVPLDELPRHLINAVLAREDIDFFNHRGFCVRGIARAVTGIIQGVNRGGGSTITQQVAGTLFTNRREPTFRRKIIELWWALQLERRYTKNEILEIYMNYMVMGPGVFGVEAASRHFFGHSARDVTLAEAAILAVQLSSPARHNPLRHPEVAMDRQRFVLDRMVSFGFATREEADESFNEFWGNFDFTRADVGAYLAGTVNNAPWFSELVRRELDGMMFGTMDYFRDGFTVHTTLNLRHQEAAERHMAAGLIEANQRAQVAGGARIGQAEQTIMPVIDLLALMFDMGGVHAASIAQDEHRAISRYTNSINPIVDMAALIFGIPELRVITDAGFSEIRRQNERSDVEGALITIENNTGHITAIVGGSEFSQANQFIRATQANVQTGSAFKPLFFSAALDSRHITASTVLHDAPIVFHNEDGTQYIPINFGGRWNGPILMHRALNISLNIPALKILDMVGFDAAIERSAALLGITDQNQIRTMFPRVYPLALGVTSTSPMRMARAFAIFGNEGREVTPIAIRRIEDRNGRVILDPERDLLDQKRRRGNPQVVSPQNAYIMSRVMQRTGEGTMSLAASNANWFRFRGEDGREFNIPVAGKTGTTQNWADAWIVGYSPYYTTAIWFGFDRPGSSLGTRGTGAGLVGPFWGRYMREIHEGRPHRDFVRPATGIIYVEVCRVSGQLASPDCSGRIAFPFMHGTQPTHMCTTHGMPTHVATQTLENLRNPLMLDSAIASLSVAMPTLPDIFLDLDLDFDFPATPAPVVTPSPAGGGAALAPVSWSAGNPLLDGGAFISPSPVEIEAPVVMTPVEVPIETPVLILPYVESNMEVEAVEPEDEFLIIIGGDADIDDVSVMPQETGPQELAFPIGNPFLD